MKSSHYSHIATQSTKTVQIKAILPYGFYLCLFLLAFWLQLLATNSLALDNNAYCQKAMAAVGLPKSQTQWTDVQCREAMTLSFHHEKRVPNWVQHDISPKSITGKANRKTMGFRRDTFIINSPSPADYTRSGYDRGHLAPAADFKSNPDQMRQSFLMSNVAPQVGQGFNRDIWRLLEEYLRQRVRENNAQATIITGTLFKKDNGQAKTIGSEKNLGTGKIAIPDYFYKIYLNRESGVALAFLMANEKHTTKKAPQTLSRFRKYQVTIDYLEQLTGLDFFCNLPDELETKLESTIHQDDENEDVVGP